MERLFKSVLNVREIKLHNDDDYIDRFSRRYTVAILIGFACLVTSKQFVGTPIHCWCPAEFTSSHIEYANQLCWVQNTYYLPMSQTIPGGPLPEEGRISYYQWVPMLLLFQSLMAFLPSQLWKFFCARSGINMVHIMDAARLTVDASNIEIRDKAIRYVSSQMDQYLLACRDHRTGCYTRTKHFLARFCCVFGGRSYGNYLVTAYLVVKIVYLLVAIGQIFFVAIFVGNDYLLYGMDVIARLMRHDSWVGLEQFPRVTLCEFEIRDQSRLHNYVLQCALGINLFNEKIFIFQWFWMIGLSSATAVSLLRWLVRITYWPAQVQYVRKRLREYDVTVRENVVMARYTENYLRRDGLFIIRLIAMNCGDIPAGEILNHLWDMYNPARRLLTDKCGNKVRAKVNRRGVTKLDI